MTIQEYIGSDPKAFLEIKNINTVFEPLGISVNEVLRCPQSIKYILYLPLDYQLQGKIRRAEPNLKYTLSSALMTSEYNYGHEKNYIYIERPTSFKVVKFSDFIPSFNQNKLLVSLGKDSNGEKVILNLSKAPHVLVGGVTGSGKSELLHTFICSLILGRKYTNAEVCIIDPKRAEYSPYKGKNGITIVTDMNEANNKLELAVQIMEKRYQILENAGAKDIKTYRGYEDMHPIVIVIDELADLMLLHKEIEKNIVKIAQKARACGIHLILGTQSPRADIVTGLIKANIPTRIALKTSSSLESRIILDRIGAESLLGKGDMLFLGNGSYAPVRIQAAYVDEIDKVSIASILPDKVIPNNQYLNNSYLNYRWGTL